jgi:RNA recognition motif-containing protein
MSTRLHVGNIPTTVAAADLEAMFSQFGSVDRVEIACDAVTGTSKGFAIVAMSRDADAVAAIGRLNFTQLAGRTIAVSMSRANNP